MSTMSHTVWPKIWLQKIAITNPCSAEQLHIRSMDIMLKILLPACFIALKLTGTFIDFMLGLSNSENDTQDVKSVTIKNWLGSEIVESFNFRTCVNPKLTKQNSGETKIVYQSLTAQEWFQKSKIFLLKNHNS